MALTVSAPVQNVDVFGRLRARLGTITVGGTAQTARAANAGRSFVLVQNQSATDLWVDFGVVAVADQPSIKVAAGLSLVIETMFIPTGFISIIGATTGQKFVIKTG